ncbi:hypothetical protein B0H12DRAFT_1305197 [Mycena haematopus]|nr:hypothetical protein B0H12DRAFT_1305197 [Mycena haematopus]
MPSSTKARSRGRWDEIGRWNQMKLFIDGLESPFQTERFQCRTQVMSVPPELEGIRQIPIFNAQHSFRGGVVDWFLNRRVPRILVWGETRLDRMVRDYAKVCHSSAVTGETSRTVRSSRNEEVQVCEKRCRHARRGATRVDVNQIERRLKASGTSVPAVIQSSSTNEGSVNTLSIPRHAEGLPLNAEP